VKIGTFDDESEARGDVHKIMNFWVFKDLFRTDADEPHPLPFFLVGIADCVSEERPLMRFQLELFRDRGFVAVVKPRSQPQ